MIVSRDKQLTHIKSFVVKKEFTGTDLKVVIFLMSQCSEEGFTELGNNYICKVLNIGSASLKRSLARLKAFNVEYFIFKLKKSYDKTSKTVKSKRVVELGSFFKT